MEPLSGLVLYWQGEVQTDCNFLASRTRGRLIYVFAPNYET